jgi:hypothetical protein
VPRHRIAVAVLVAALCGASSAHAKDEPETTKPAKGCAPPGSGFHSCLQVRYRTTPEGSAEHVRVTATLLRRVDRCARRITPRRVVLRRDGDERLAAARTRGSCRDGLARWRVRFDTDETGAWGLRAGMTVRSAWSGTRASTSVRIRDSAVPPRG